MSKFTKAGDGELIYVARVEKSGNEPAARDPLKWFEARYDLKDYKPEEVVIKVNKDFVKLDGKHKGAMGSKSFYKEFVISDGVNIEKLDCTVYANGMLVISGSINAVAEQEEDESEYTTTTPVSDSSEAKTKLVESGSTKTQTISGTKQTTTSTSSIVRRTEDVRIKAISDFNSIISAKETENFEDISKEIRQVNDGKKFETKLDVSEYKPEEIQVKITKTVVIISARQVTTTTRKEIYKKFTIPQGVNPENITGTLDPNGILTISAPIEQVQPGTVVCQQQQQVQQQQDKSNTKVVTSTGQVHHKSVTQVQETSSVVRKSSATSISSEVSSSSSSTEIDGEFTIRPYLENTTSSTTRTTRKSTSLEEVRNDGKNFEVQVDVSDYKVEEIQLKVTKTHIKVSAEHKTQYERRTYYKEFTLPSGAKPEDIKSNLSPDGILTIAGPITSSPNSSLVNIQDKSSTSQVRSVSQQQRQESVTSSTSVVQQSQVRQQSVSVESSRKISSQETRVEDCNIRAIMDDAPVNTNVEDISKQLRKINEGKKLEITLDVREYKPEEIQVRISKNTVIIEARRVTETTRTEICKRFSLPPGVKPETIESTLSPNGVLKISAPIQESPSGQDMQLIEQQVQAQEQKTTSSTKTVTQAVQESSDQSQSVVTSIKSETRTRRIEKECTLSPTIDTEDNLAIDSKYEDVSKQLCQINEPDGEKFEIKLDVPDYNPEELQVKITKTTITIQGRQEIREENKVSTKQFFKKVTIPQGVNPEDITSTLSPDGVLRITAKRTTTTTQIQQQQQKSITSTTTTKQNVQETNQSITEESPIQPMVDLNSEITKEESNYDDVSKQVTNVNKKFEVNLEVKEYKREEIQVKIYRKTVIVVCKSKTTTKTLTKRFTIPQGANPETITSTVTPAGVLRISAPTTETSTTEVQKNTQNTDSKQSKTTTTTTSSSKKVLKTTIISEESLKKMGYDFSNAKTEVYTGDPKFFQKTVEIKGYNPQDFEVKISGNWVIVEAKQEMTPENNFKSKSCSKMFTVPEGTKPENICCELSDEGVLNCTAPIG